MDRNPLRGKVAIVGVGTTEYGRDLGRSRADLAVEACQLALGDAGVRREDVDGLSGSAGPVTPRHVQEGLGVPELTWWSAPPMPFTFALSDAVNAVFAGACTTAIVYHAQFRTSALSASAAREDRVRAAPDGFRRLPTVEDQYLRPYGGRSASYAGYMRRYMHEYGVPREHFGLVAVNAHSCASSNPHAVSTGPLTLDSYLTSRWIREPMCIYDMDYPVDGADAFVVTTPDRSAALRSPTVYVDAIAYGQQERAHDDFYRDLVATGQSIAVRSLFEKTACRPEDADVLFVYDGYTVVALAWLESLGLCRRGEAGQYLEDNWAPDEQRIKVGGRVPINPHGGSLADGATQGAGHIREAVLQLRGEAGDRQVPGAELAILGLGGLFFNATALTLRARRPE